MNPKKLKRRKRTLAAGLALMIAVPMAGYAGVPTVQAEGNQFTVIDIDAIDESYQNQTLPAGSAESDIQFPQKLGITYNEAMDIQITGQNTAANDGETPGTGDDAGT